MNKNPQVDIYLEIGCGRCPLGNTPDCKVHTWTNELIALRSLLLDCGLTEERKWGVPTYMWKNTNVLILSAFKESCTLNFFKGSLLDNSHGLLVKPGPNSQAGRFLRFTSVDEITSRYDLIKSIILEAIEIEEKGLKPEIIQNPEPIPDELQTFFDNDPNLKNAFESLTPGRQRGYILYFIGAKQSQTRISRIEKYIPQILNGIGIHDEYRKSKR